MAYSCKNRNLISHASYKTCNFSPFSSLLSIFPDVPVLDPAHFQRNVKFRSWNKYIDISPTRGNRFSDIQREICIRGTLDFRYTPYTWRKKSGSDCESRKGGAHISAKCVECVRHLGLWPSPFIAGERAVVTPDPPAIISFLFTQHIVSGLRVVCRSIRHRLFLPAAVIYLGTEIRFANRAASHCCVPRRKAAFIVIFTFTSHATAPGTVAHRCIDWCISSFEAIAHFRTMFSLRYITAFNTR